MHISLDELKELEKALKKKSYKAKAQTALWKSENKDRIKEYNRQYYLKRKAAKLRAKEGADYGRE